MGKRFAKAITVLALTAALILTGTVPSFGNFIYADEKPDIVTEHDVVPAADFDKNTQLKVEGTSAILMDAGSGTILYEKDAYAQRDLASITKIITCMVALENLDLDQEITATFQPTDEGTSLKIKKGETFRVEDLLYALMLRSANDAAEVLAVAVGGDIDTFVGMMNEYAASCGAENTHFKNPNGLNPDKVNNLTTAYDLALISRCAMNNPQFREIVGTKRYSILPTNKTKKTRKMINHNLLLVSKDKVEINGVKREIRDDRCIGIKTGYTSSAGDCVVAEGKEGKTELISVVLNSPHEINKFVDTLYIWDYGFGNFESCRIAKKAAVQYDLPVKYGEKHAVELGLEKDMLVTVNKGRSNPENFTTKVEVKEQKPEAPIRKGDVMGQLVAYNADDQAVAVGNLIALEESDEGGPLSRIGIADEDVPLFILILTAVLIVIISIIIRLTRRKDTAEEK